MSNPISTIDDVANMRAIAAAVTANPGAIAIQNVAGTLKQVDDQGNVSSLGGGGGGSGTVTSVAATAGGLLAVAGTPTVAPTVGLAAAAGNTIIGNATGGSAVPTALTATQVNTLLGTAKLDVARAFWGFAVSKYATLRGYDFFDFDRTATDFASAVAAGGAVNLANSAARNGGVVALQPGTTTGGTARVGGFGQASNVGQILKTKTQAPWFVGAQVNRLTAPDAGMDLRLQILNWQTAGCASVGIFGTTSTTNMVYSTDGGSTFVDSGVTIASVFPISTWTALGIGFDGTTVTFYAGDPATGSMASFATSTSIGSLPDIIASVMMGGGQIAGGAAATTQVDNVFIAWG